MKLRPIKFSGELILYPLFVKYFRDKGWTIKTNCKKIGNAGNTKSGDIDVLGIKDGDLLAGEIKLRFTSRVMEQATNHLSFADYVFVGFIDGMRRNFHAEHIGVYVTPKTYGFITYQNKKTYMYGCIDLDKDIIARREMQKNTIWDRELKKAYIKKYFTT